MESPVVDECWVPRDGYIQARLHQISQTDPRILFAADALRTEYRRLMGRALSRVRRSRRQQ